MRRNPLRSTAALVGCLIPFSAITAVVMMAAAPASALTITPIFTANFNTNFGSNAAAAQAAWIAAANIFTTNFSDPIHVNIIVDAVAGTSVYGESGVPFTDTTYANLRTLMVADSKTADDATALAAGGSLTTADPTAGAGTWWVTPAQAKAIGLIPDDLSIDGQNTFGAGWSFVFSGVPSANSYSFQGVAAHEISEVMGRVGLSGGFDAYSLIDDFGYSGAGARTLTAGPNDYFSIDNGTTLLKHYNDQAGFDTKDWASDTDDSFNLIAYAGFLRPVSETDLREMDVIGYDRTAVPEPAAGTLALIAFGVGITSRRGKKQLAR